MGLIVFCAALPVEVKSLCARLGVAIPNRKNRFLRVRSPIGDGEWWIAVSGVGIRNMDRLLRSLVDEPVEVWASLGVAGALRPDLAVGDTLYGSVIKQDDTRLEPISARKATSRESVLYCAANPLYTPKEKQDAFRRTGADVVDMESAAVARWAMRRGEPFAFARVVSDAAEETIQPEVMNCLGSDGLPSIPASLNVLARKPWLLPTFVQLGLRSERLSARLADAAFELAKSIQ